MSTNVIAKTARWLFLPVWLAQVFTAAKSFAANPVLGSPKLNRRGLHVWRARLAQTLAQHRRRRLAHGLSEADRAAFERDGFILKPDLLSPEQFAVLVREVLAFSGQAREMREGDAATRRIALTPDALRRLPACRALLESPEWRGVTAYVASTKAEPTYYIQTIFSRCGSGEAADPQTVLHMDTFHPTMKAWLFLHDVEIEAGPLTYVPGSHRLTRRRLAWQRAMSVRAAEGRGTKGGAFRLSEKDRLRLGFPEARPFAVPGNTLVVADTCGFHARGKSTQSSVRIEIYATSRRNPFLPWSGFDLWRLPVLRYRQALAEWWLEDRLAPLGLMRRAWRDVGRISPAAPLGGREPQPLPFPSGMLLEGAEAVSPPASPAE